MSKRLEQCDKCKSWDSTEFPPEEGRVDMGYCRHHSPSLVYGISEPLFRANCCVPPHQSYPESCAYDTASEAVWPITRDWDWCGEFHPVESPTFLSEMNFSIRTQHAFNDGKLRTLDDLLKMSEGDLLEIRHFGILSLREVRAALGDRGLRLKVIPIDVDVSQVWSELPQRLRTQLIRDEIDTLEKLVLCSDQDILELRNIGETTLSQLRQTLAGHGLKLRGYG